MLATGKAAPAATAPASSATRRARVHPRLGVVADIAATLALLALAAATRLPFLESAPRFRDETFNALHSLRIYRGEHFPFTDVEYYIGAFFNYAVAAGMFIVGPTIYAARIVVTAFGVATVGVSYFLGRELGGRVVGLIAAAFTATNGIHISPMGHVAFSGSITPFFTTLAFWLLHRSRHRASGPIFVWAGLMLGMSMHTHPTIVAFLPGVAGWYLWRNLGVLRTRWPYLAAGAFVLAFSPMIVFNIITGGESIRHALWTANERPDYARNKSTELNAESYVARQKDFWLMLHGTLGGAVDEREGWTGYVTDPPLVATSAATIAGLAWAARRHRYTLPLWLLGSFALILPIFNANHYDVEYDGRYVVPLLPMFYAAIGLLAVDLWNGARERLRNRTARMMVGSSIAALVLFLAFEPLISLNRYNQRASRADPTNASLVRTVGAVKAALGPGDIAIVDRNLNDRKVEYASPWDEASTYRVIKYIMEFDRVPYADVEVNDATLADLARRGQGGVVVLSAGFDSKDTANLGELIERYGLQSLDGRPPRAPRPNDRYGLYRLDPSVAARAASGR